MATKNGNLEQALAILIQNQAQFVAGAAAQKANGDSPGLSAIWNKSRSCW